MIMEMEVGRCAALSVNVMARVFAYVHGNRILSSLDYHATPCSLSRWHREGFCTLP